MRLFPFFCVALLCLMVGDAFSLDAAPREVWRYEALSNLYAPPLAADVTGDGVKEIIISDSEARRVRCIDAKGNLLWECDGGWTKRLISPAALSAVARDGLRRLAVANGDGSLTCMNALDGAVLWRRDIGAVEWGGPLWARLDGSDEQTIVTGTEHDGVAAVTRDGETRWRVNADAAAPPLHIRGPLAAADISGDGGDAIFGASRFGLFCIDADGALAWEQYTGDDFPGGLVIADADGDGRAELYAVSNDDAYLWRFDAATGAPAWKAPLHGVSDVYSASSIAVGDISGDGNSEIVLGDARGHVYAFDHGGTLLWTFAAIKPTHSAVSLGDVTGDGRVDALAASGDHHLYCLDGQGRLLWRYKTDLRLIYPATLVDLDNNGMTDILLCGSDRQLRRLTLDQRYSTALMPWPARRYDAAQRGASFDGRVERPPLATRVEALVVHGDFEQGKVRDGLEQFDRDSPFYQTLMSRPRGWRAETRRDDTTWGISDAAAYTGEHALLLAGGMTASSEPARVAATWRRVSATAHSNDGNARATLRWLGVHGVIREDTLTATDTEGAWTRFAVQDAPPPPGARWISLALSAGDGPGYWDDASVAVVHEEPAAFDILVNQVGYDKAAPKRFLAQANFVADNATFAVINENQQAVFTGTLRHEGRIRGHYGNDWGHEYYSGDFSAFDDAGLWRVQVALDGLEDASWPFEIGDGTLWRRTSEPAYRFFYYQRCGMAIPGWYEACHLDDAVCPDGITQYELWGGWHDAGDYNKYHNAPYVYGLATAYAQQRSAFDALGAATDGSSAFFDEILWGGDHVRRMVMDDGSAFGHITSGYGYWGPPHLETDNIPNTGDERRGTRERGDNPDAHQAALARIAVLLDGRDAGGAPAAVWAETAARSLEYALDEGRRGLWQLSAAVDLFVVAGDDGYRDLATALLEDAQQEPEISVMRIETTRRYDAAFGADHAAALRDAVLERAETMLAQAANPFGVYTFGPPENPNFFNTPADQGGWHVGTSSHLLEAATFMALAHDYKPDPRYLRFVYDQFNWTLGMNPYNISLMEGAGSAFAPSYHHRYAFAGVPRGAVPGGVVNGITWRSVGDDRPSFDMSGVDIPAYESNEVWLPHNTAYLNALAQLMRTRAAQ